MKFNDNKCFICIGCAFQFLFYNFFFFVILICCVVELILFFVVDVVNKYWFFLSTFLLMQLQEAKQALELMGRWEMIDVSDALELLSPLFESEEVGLFLR